MKHPTPEATRARLADKAARIEDAALGANAAHLPGPTAAAFAGQPVRVGKLLLRSPCIGDFDLLQRLGNPIAELAERALTGEPWEPKLTLSQIREAIFQFSLTNPDLEIWARRLDSDASGLSEYRAAAARATAALPFDPVGLLSALRDIISQAFTTSVDVAAKGEGSGKAPGHPTASGGPSPSAAGSPPSATVPPNTFDGTSH